MCSNGGGDVSTRACVTNRLTCDVISTVAFCFRWHLECRVMFFIARDTRVAPHALPSLGHSQIKQKSRLPGIIGFIIVSGSDIPSSYHTNVWICYPEPKTTKAQLARELNGLAKPRAQKRLKTVMMFSHISEIESMPP